MTTSSIAKAIARIPKSVARGSRSRCRMIRPMEGRRRDGRGAARRGRIVRISGWHINGFGMFADYRLDDLSPGLTVLHGPNEAGKSTLVNYILSILFGFADGRSKGPRYEPLVGGNHGGKLFLEDGEGTYVVERTKAGKIPTVRYPDGGAGSGCHSRSPRWSRPIAVPERLRVQPQGAGGSQGATRRLGEGTHLFDANDWRGAFRSRDHQAARVAREATLQAQIRVHDLQSPNQARGIRRRTPDASERSQVVRAGDARPGRCGRGSCRHPAGTRRGGAGGQPATRCFRRPGCIGPSDAVWRKKPQPSKSQMAWSSRSRPSSSGSGEGDR